MDMNVELRHVMIGELYEQNWLLNKQVAGLQNDLVGARNALAEAAKPVNLPGELIHNGIA